MQRLCGGALIRITNSRLQTNTWLLAAPGRAEPGSACVVVDAGLDHAALDAALQATGWVPSAVLCTHGHFDHIGGAARLQQRFALPVLLDRADLKTAQLSNFLMAAIKLPGRIQLPEFTLVDTRTSPVPWSAAGRHGLLHALPGHTPGGCAIACEGLLFTGDSLYARHVGLSRLPGEDHALLRHSLQGLLSWAEPQTLVLPGHGGTATLADIRHGNQALRAFLEQTDAVPATATP